MSAWPAETAELAGLVGSTAILMAGSYCLIVGSIVDELVGVPQNSSAESLEESHVASVAVLVAWVAGFVGECHLRVPTLRK